MQIIPPTIPTGKLGKSSSAEEMRQARDGMGYVQVQSNGQRTPAVRRRVVIAEKYDGANEVDLVTECSDDQDEEVGDEPHLGWNERVILVETCLPP